MSKQQTLVILMSPAGGAKGVIAEYLLSTKKNAVYIKKNKNNTYEQFYQSINNLIAGNHKYIIVSDYNVTVQERMTLFKNINLHNIHVIGVWIKVPIHLAKQYNKKKKVNYQVDEKLIDKQFKYSVSPTNKEPFDDIVYISKDRITSGLGISKNFPKIVDMYKILDKI